MPWEHSALMGPFYFKAGANPTPPPYIANPVLPAPAAPQTNASRAERGSCKWYAEEKKLAGDALNSFMRGCENNSQKFCDTAAMERKLAGKAKLAFIKACTTTAVGN